MSKLLELLAPRGTRNLKIVDATGRDKVEPVEKLPFLDATAHELQTFLADRSYLAYKMKKHENEDKVDVQKLRSRLVASTIAAVEATEYAQNTGRAEDRAKAYRRFYKAALQVTKRLEESFDSDGQPIKDESRTKSFKKNYGDYPGEVDRATVNKIAGALGVKGDSLGVMQAAGMSEMLAIVDTLVTSTGTDENVTFAQTAKLLDQPGVVTQDDFFREMGYLDKIAQQGEKPLNAESLTGQQKQAVDIAMRLGHVTWAACQVYRAIWDGKDDRIKVYAFDNNNQLRQVGRDGSLSSPVELTTGRSVSYNSLDTTIAFTYEKFKQLLQGRAEQPELTTRLRTAFEIWKDKVMFDEPEVPMPKVRRR